MQSGDNGSSRTLLEPAFMSKITRNSSRPQPKPNARAVPKEVQQLQKNKRATVTRNADGSVTRRSSTAQSDQTVTTSKGKLRETRLEYQKSSVARGVQSESTFTAVTDMLGRASSSATRTVADQKGDVTNTSRGTDIFGVEKRTKEKATSRTKGNTTTDTTKFSSNDSRGNALSTSDVTRTRFDERTMTVDNERREKGTDLATRSSTTYEDQRFNLSDGADWKKTNSIGKSTMRETETTFDPSRLAQKTDRAANWLGRGLSFLGINEEWSSEVAPERMQENILYQSDSAGVTTQIGVTGGQSLALNEDGVQASVGREARAGVYAGAEGGVGGRYGEAGYSARAQAEVAARVNADARVDTNGLMATATVGARAGVEVEVTGGARSQSVTLSGVDLNASVEGRARASAEVAAEATGTLSIGRNPPTAILEGSAGLSAVAKAEADFKASAGPFSVTGSAYASAGAEATASGVLGYSDGKLRVGGRVGAAVGLGAGAGATVEIDVSQIGQMAKNAADLNGDGKLGLGDVAAAGRGAVDLASRAASAVRDAADVNGDGRVDSRDARAALSNTASRAAGAVSSGARKVASFFGW